MGDSEFIRDWFKERSSDPVVLEIINMWLHNRSAKGANYGGDKFWRAVISNLETRYDVIRVTRIADEVRKLIETHVGVIGRNKLDDRFGLLLDSPMVLPLEERLIDLLKNDEELRKHACILAEYLIEEDFAGYDLTGSQKRSINSRLKKKLARDEIFDFDDFIKIGFMYKLPWVKTDFYASEETLYSVPSHSVIALAELYTHPDLKRPYRCRFCDKSFTNASEMTSHEYGCSEKSNNLEKPMVYHFAADRPETSQTLPEQRSSEVKLENGICLIKRGEGTSAGLDLLLDIISSARERIIIEDNYINVALLKRLLSNTSAKIKILTSFYNIGDRDFTDMLETRKFLKSLENEGDTRLRIKETHGAWTHDRILITESGGWAFSTSLKDSINDSKWSLVFHLPAKVTEYIQEEFQGLWEASSSVTSSTYNQIVKSFRK